MRRVRNGSPVFSVGSGGLVDSRGLVLTCDHVIEGADGLDVGLNRDRVQAASPGVSSRDRDLAVIKTALRIPDPRDVLHLGEAASKPDRMQLYGFPDAGPPKSTGVTSISWPAPRDGLVEPAELIRLAGRIRPGDSGGPLIDCDNAIVGIVQARYDGDDKAGFASPASRALGLVRTAKARASLDQPRWIGATFGDSPAGPSVIGVLPASELAGAGVAAGDRIVAVAGKPTVTATAVEAELAGAKHSVPVAVSTGEGVRTLNVRLVAPPDWRGDELGSSGGRRRLGGATVVVQTPALALAYALDPHLTGYLVLDAGKAEADQMGFEPGDLLISAGPPTKADLERLQAAFASNSFKGFTVRRGEEVIALT